MCIYIITFESLPHLYDWKRKHCETHVNLVVLNHGQARHLLQFYFYSKIRFVFSIYMSNNIFAFTFFIVDVVGNNAIVVSRLNSAKRLKYYCKYCQSQILIPKKYFYSSRLSTRRSQSSRLLLINSVFLRYNFFLMGANLVPAQIESRSTFLVTSRMTRNWNW